jgi:zinc/manganese transport system substrate-binding protein
MFIAGSAALALTLAGCAAGADAQDAGEAPVATTTIWGSITGQITACAGDGETITLMPVGADPHDYSPSSSDVATMVGAPLVVANGLGLEEGLEGALTTAGADGARIFEVAPELDPIPFAEEPGHSEGEEHSEDEEHAEGEEHGHDGDDPHVWQDMGRAATAAQLIGVQLTEATGDDAYTACGQEVADDILAAQVELEQILSVIPEQDRILVTDHDALGYFADAYGFTIAGVVVPGGSTLAETSSAQLAELTATVRETGVPAIFSNTATSSAVVDALASEAGGVEVVALYVDSIGEPGTDAATYQGMMVANATAIAEALA